MSTLDNFIKNNKFTALKLEVVDQENIYFDNFKKRNEPEPDFFDLVFLVNNQYHIIKFPNKSRYNDIDFDKIVDLNKNIEKKNKSNFLAENLSIKNYAKSNYETEVIRFVNQILGPGDTIIDVGANIGMINLNIAINNPLTKIIGFEAQKVNYKINKFLADKLLLKNIKLHDIALGEVEGKGRLFQSVIENGQDSFIQTLDELGNKTHDDDYQDVQIKNLDSFNLKKVKIVKIDVEGFELNVLKGAKNLISDFLPIIIFENTLNYFKYDKDVFFFLKSHNYRIFLCGFIQDEKVYINSNYFDEIKRNKLIFFELRDYNDRINIVLKTVNLYAFSNEHISSFFQK